MLATLGHHLQPCRERAAAEQRVFGDSFSVCMPTICNGLWQNG